MTGQIHRNRAIFMNSKNYTQALHMFETGLDIAMNTGCLISQRDLLFKIAKMYLIDYHEYRKACDYLLKCLNVFQVDEDSILELSFLGHFRDDAYDYMQITPDEDNKFMEQVRRIYSHRQSVFNEMSGPTLGMFLRDTQ